MPQEYQITSAAVSDRGLSEKRPQNEDSYLEIPLKGIFAVADGVGGAQAGEVASQMAMEILGEAFNNMPVGADAEDTMERALVQANVAINQMSSELPQLAQMATTVVALHLDGNIATIGHAGDSRLYRLDTAGVLHRETEDHSMVADEVRAGRMTEEQAENHPGKNIINRALGAESSVDLDLTTKIVASDSTFLLCSDGVTRHIPDAELASLLKDLAPEQACDRIKDICYERGAEDNLTAVVVRYEMEASETDFVDTLAIQTDEDSEPTVASARNELVEIDPDDDDLLELDTVEIMVPPSEVPAEQDILGFNSAEEEKVADVSTDEDAELPIAATQDEPDQSFDKTVEIAAAAAEEPAAPIVPVQDHRPMFGLDDRASIIDRSAGSKTLPAAIGALVLGAIIGLGVYHFLLVTPPTPTGPAIDQMHAQNIPLTAFEENRRNVDRDPTLYIQRAGAPEDAEDHYLLGRAYLLTGDFPNARTRFTEARDRLAGADPANAQVMKDDIALAMAVTNDTTIQNILRKELEVARPATNTAVNAVR